MTRHLACRLATALWLALASSTAPAQNYYKASALELAQLPKFCWSQYMDIKGPEYEIRDCGVRMNHYCPALQDLMRANKALGKPEERRRHLVLARRETLYTVNGMKDYPACPIRAHVEGTLRQIEGALMAYPRR